MRRPSLSRALAAGLLLGTRPAHRLYFAGALRSAGRSCGWFTSSHETIGPESAIAAIGRRIGEFALIFLLSLWVINMGYGFVDSGRPLNDLPLTSRVLSGVALPSGSDMEHSESPLANSWIGSLVVPLPADYLLGIDRRWYETETRSYSPRAGDRPPPGWGEFTWATLGAKVPLGLLGLAVWSLILTALRHASCAPLSDELFLWLPFVLLSALGAFQIGLNFPMHWIVVLIPYLIVGVSKLAYFLQARPLADRMRSSYCLRRGHWTAASRRIRIR